MGEHCSAPLTRKLATENLQFFFVLSSFPFERRLRWSSVTNVAFPIAHRKFFLSKVGNRVKKFGMWLAMRGDFGFQLLLKPFYQRQSAKRGFFFFKL